MKRAAIFDFDLTITNFDSFRSFLSYYYWTLPSNRLYLPYIFGVIILRKMRLISLFNAKQFLLRGLKGKSRNEIRVLANQYLGKYGDILLNKKAVEQIELHRTSGDLVFVITSAPNLIFEELETTLRVTEIIANELLYSGDIFTGKLEPFDCFGANKAVVVQRLAEKYSLDLKNSAAYSDHHSDIPMLQCVGKPVAVNPDPALKRYALDKEWRVLIW